MSGRALRIRGRWIRQEKMRSSEHPSEHRAEKAKRCPALHSQQDAGCKHGQRDQAQNHLSHGVSLVKKGRPGHGRIFEWLSKSTSPAISSTSNRRQRERAIAFPRADEVQLKHNQQIDGKLVGVPATNGYPRPEPASPFRTQCHQIATTEQKQEFPPKSQIFSHVNKQNGLGHLTAIPELMGRCVAFSNGGGESIKSHLSC